MVFSLTYNVFQVGALRAASVMRLLDVIGCPSFGVQILINKINAGIKCSQSVLDNL